MNKFLTPRRLERYLAIGWDGGAVPVVVLTKSDLCSPSGETPGRRAQSVAIRQTIIMTTTQGGGGFQGRHAPTMQPGCRL